MYAFSRFDEQMKRRLLWAVKFKKQCSGVDLIKFSYTSILYPLAKLENKNGNIEAR
jgi:hypothetical protein